MGLFANAIVDLPCGLIANTNANSVCTEAQLIMEELFGCPDESQIGLADTSLHNMVPPPGMAA